MLLGYPFKKQIFPSGCFVHSLPLKYFVVVWVDRAFDLLVAMRTIWNVPCLCCPLFVMHPALLPQHCPQSSKVSYAILVVMTFWQNLLLLHWVWSLRELPILLSVSKMNHLLHSMNFSTLCEIFLLCVRFLIWALWSVPPPPPPPSPPPVRQMVLDGLLLFLFPFWFCNVSLTTVVL